MANQQTLLDQVAELLRWKTAHTRRVSRLENNAREDKERIKTLEYKVFCLEHKSEYLAEVSATTHREVFDNDPQAYQAPSPPPAVDPDVVRLRNRRQRARNAARRRSDERLELLKAATDEAQVVTTEVRAATTEAREAKGELVQATTDGLAAKSQMEAAASDLRVLLERIPVSREEATESAPYVDPTPPGAGNIDTTRRRLQFSSAVPSSGSLEPSDTDSTPPVCLSVIAPALPTCTTTTAAVAPVVQSSSGSIDPSDTDSTPVAGSSSAPPASSLLLSSPKKVGSGSQAGGSDSPRRSPRLKEKAAKSPPVTPIKSPTHRRKSQDGDSDKEGSAKKRRKT